MDSIEQYIVGCEPDTQSMLRQMYGVIKEVAPHTTESISWAMPTLSTGTRRVHFAGYRHHVGLYPGAATIAAFAPQLTPYKWSKGAVQFKLSEPLPVALIQAMVKHCLYQGR